MGGLFSPKPAPVQPVAAPATNVSGAPEDATRQVASNQRKKRGLAQVQQDILNAAAGIKTKLGD